MEQFREKLKIDNLLTALAVFILGVFHLLTILGYSGVIPFFKPVAGGSHWQDMWSGFVSGASAGILGVMAFFLVRNLVALRDEKKLKKLYVRENDERLIQVWTKARSSALQAFLILGLVAAVIAGYFSPTVSITIVCCLFFASITGLFFKIYYNIKL